MQRSKMEQELRVGIEKQLIATYKSIETEDGKRKETTDELFKQINHYTKRIKNSGNLKNHVSSLKLQKLKSLLPLDS